MEFLEFKIFVDTIGYSESTRIYLHDSTTLPTHTLTDILPVNNSALQIVKSELAVRSEFNDPLPFPSFSVSSAAVLSPSA